MNHVKSNEIGGSNMQRQEVVQTVNYFDDVPVRAVLLQNKTWLVARDVTKAMGYSNSRQAIKNHVSKLDKGVTKIDTLTNGSVGGGLQEATIINESGFNALILHSKKPKAKKFQRFITSEVIPQILRTGKYVPKSKQATNSYPKFNTADTTPKLIEQIKYFEEFKAFQEAQGWV